MISSETLQNRSSKSTRCPAFCFKSLTKISDRSANNVTIRFSHRLWNPGTIALRLTRHVAGSAGISPFPMMGCRISANIPLQYASTGASRNTCLAMTGSEMTKNDLGPLDRVCKQSIQCVSRRSSSCHPFIHWFVYHIYVCVCVCVCVCYLQTEIENGTVFLKVFCQQ